MATKMPAVDLPTGVEVERFARRTLKIGFVGGQEKDVRYDSRVQKESDFTHYRQFVERETGSPGEAIEDLKSEVPKRDVLRADEMDISYTEFVGAEELYLVTWDHGQTIHIMEEEEMLNVVEAVAESEGRLRPQDARTEMSELFADEEEEPPAPAIGESESPVTEQKEEEEEGEIPEPVSEAEDEPPAPVQ